MESGTRKKRTLAERRESDKLRQRRFRAKKKERSRLLEVISGVASGDGTLERRERVYTVPRKTAEEIRETNRIRQQRFRAKNKPVTGADHVSDDSSMDTTEPVCKKKKVLSSETSVQPAAGQDNPIEIIQRILLQTLSEEKDRQVEVRREKDRIRKRRERQRKKENELRKAGVNPEEFQARLNQIDMDTSREDEEEDIVEEETDTHLIESPATLIKHELEDPEEEIGGGSSFATNGFFDTIQSLSQAEQMDFLLKLASTVEMTSLHLPSISPETTQEELGASSSSPILQFTHEETPTPEKKPWQRCSSSEERRERERMRKRMYRAKQKFISTGKLEMQWDPTPIKRTPNDDGELGITPIPEWTKNLSSEQKLAAHRIYNKRYRERIKNCTGTEKEISRDQEAEEVEQQADIDFSNLPPEVYQEILATIAQCDLSSLSQNQSDE